jgi:hypothetical protein
MEFGKAEISLSDLFSSAVQGVSQTRMGRKFCNAMSQKSVIIGRFFDSVLLVGKALVMFIIAR